MTRFDAGRLAKPTRTVYFQFATSFTKTPGGRLRKHGRFSGEQFREEVLRPALERGEGLRIDMSNVLGVGSSFLDEAFGLFANEIGIDRFRDFFVVYSETNPFLSEDLGQVLSTKTRARPHH